MFHAMNSKSTKSDQFIRTATRWRQCAYQPTNDHPAPGSSRRVHFDLYQDGEHCTVSLARSVAQQELVVACKLNVDIILRQIIYKTTLQ